MHTVTNTPRHCKPSLQKYGQIYQFSDLVLSLAIWKRLKYLNKFRRFKNDITKSHIIQPYGK